MKRFTLKRKKLFQNIIRFCFLSIFLLSQIIFASSVFALFGQPAAPLEELDTAPKTDADRRRQIDLENAEIGERRTQQEIDIQERVNNRPKTSSAEPTGYKPLSGNGAEEILPGISGGSDINAMLYGFYKWGVGIAVLIALVYVVIGGIKYMTTDAIYDKGEGRKMIQNAFLGLIIALSSVVILNTINRNIVQTRLDFSRVGSEGTNQNIPISLIPLTGSRAGTGITGIDTNGYPVLDTSGVEEAVRGGFVVAENGQASIDFDGSQGAYRVVEDPNGDFTINGKKYKSIGYENLGNAGLKDGTSWWGVAKDSNGKVIMNSEGYLRGQVSYNGVDGNKRSFVALTDQQVAAIRGSGRPFKLGDTVIVTNNQTGKSVKAIYADNAGSNQKDPANHTEIGPVTAQALGIKYGKNAEGKAYAEGSLTFTLPD